LSTFRICSNAFRFSSSVFDATQSRLGYHLNMFCMSLMKAPNREAFRADPRGYLDRWPMTEAQKQAVLDRDWNEMLRLGGNIYFTSKIAATDGAEYKFLFMAKGGGSANKSYLFQETKALLNVTPRNVWRFRDASGAERAVRVAGTLHSNNGDLLAEVAARGAGIVFEPAFIVGPDVRAGRLVPLLQEYTPPPVPIYAVYPSRKHLSAKVRRFVEFLVERFAQVRFDAA